MKHVLVRGVVDCLFMAGCVVVSVFGLMAVGM